MKKVIPILIVCLITQLSFAHQIRQGLDVEKVVPGFYVYTTYHDYNGKPFPANSMYVVTPKGIIMIDVPWDTTQTIPLLRYFKKQYHKKVLLCIATHFHNDRTGALNILKREGIPTYSSAHTLALCKQHNEPQAAYTFNNDITFHFGDYTFEAYYPGAGHTVDNIVIWFGKQKILYGGCLVKSTEAKDLGNLEDADVTAWPHSIENLMKRYPDARYVIPGHNGWKSTRSLQHTLDLLRKHNK